MWFCSDLMLIIPDFKLTSLLTNNFISFNLLSIESTLNRRHLNKQCVGEMNFGRLFSGSGQTEDDSSSSFTQERYMDKDGESPGPGGRQIGGRKIYQ